MKTSGVAEQQQDSLLYPSAAKRHDEVYTPEGKVRPHWQYLLDSLATLGQSEMAQRQLKTQRILRDDGATYSSAERPNQSNIWELDPVPMLLDSEEWSSIEAGLIERAELLDLVLKDIYGERALIRHGILPPELLFDHKGFIRACHDVFMPGEQQLIFHSADMIRTQDGSICVLTDRTQMPKGVGYALENRTVLSRVFPSLFRDSQVHRLALFYQALRQKLNELVPYAPDGRPRVVVMTPGTFNQSYFEHTYLANYLGYPLVQGGDLTVRGGRVWMKSVGGLHPVDVIIRFVNDIFCDPVELRSDSHLGVPGLLEVVRSGGVAVVNPLGSGVLENPALQCYLPKISEFFLGRPLQLKSVNSYWCGDKKALEFILAHFDEMVLKAVNPTHDNQSVFVAELSPEERAKWLARIQAEPNKWVAQDLLEPSQCPTLVDGDLQPRRVIFRSFAVASEQSFNVMPGCMARIAPDMRSRRVVQGQGSLSKDTWVLASEPEKQFSLQQVARDKTYSDTDMPANLPSRAVENLFWMGRYAERAETSARMLRTVFMQLNSTLQLPKDARHLMLIAVTDVTNTRPGFRGPDAARLFDAPEKELLSVILDTTRPGSLRYDLHAMLSCAEEVKEQLSADAQRIVNDIRDELNQLDAALAGGLGSAPEEALDPLVTALLALAGQAHESMFRGVGWRFLEMGRRLEKAHQSAGMIRSLLVSCFEGRSQDLLLETLLLSTEALISYRRRYLAQLDIGDGLKLMLMDRSNPRSMLFLMQELTQHLDTLESDLLSQSLTPEQKQLLSATTELQLADIEALEKADEEGIERTTLDAFLKSLQERLRITADLISDRYFDHTAGPQQLVQTGWEIEA
ncbi:circularly permuted type 2 ATP-grasp protein [Pontibacter sp. JAM-7]|uniref:circularly permuted type 2 ATP-grasp protein n=1 Tax=Pontibacter sp. JAM-7 TaxID=3366581 RepID=UPI003AF6840E